MGKLILILSNNICIFQRCISFSRAYQVGVSTVLKAAVKRLFIPAEPTEIPAAHSLSGTKTLVLNRNCAWCTNKHESDVFRWSPSFGKDVLYVQPGVGSAQHLTHIELLVTMGRFYRSVSTASENLHDLFKTKLNVTLPHKTMCSESPSVVAFYFGYTNDDREKVNKACNEMILFCARGTKDSVTDHNLPQRPIIAIAPENPGEHEDICLSLVLCVNSFWNLRCRTPSANLIKGSSFTLINCI